MKTEYAQKMMFHGILVFMIGLITGFFLYSGLMRNPQIGVITHLEGVLNGMFLVILGLIWHRMKMTDKLQKRFVMIAIACVYINYFQALWGAVLGRSRATTLFPADRVPFPAETFILNVFLLSMSFGLIWCCIMVMIGLKRGLAGVQKAALARPETV